MERTQVQERRKDNKIKRLLDKNIPELRKIRIPLLLRTVLAFPKASNNRFDSTIRCRSGKNDVCDIAIPLIALQENLQTQSESSCS